MPPALPPPPRTSTARRRVTALLLVTASACVPIGRDAAPAPAELEPQFAPESAVASDPLGSDTAEPTTSATEGTTSPSDPVATDPGPTSPGPTTPPKDGPSPTATPFRGSATVTDDPSDRTPTLERSPDWADLESVTIERDGPAMTLTIGLAGGAPEAAPDDQHTMNIATFFDVDGDGFLDYEIWANVNDGGWGTAYYDNVEGRAVFADEDGIEIEVVDGKIVMTFDASLLASAERFRFATSSEYGRYETIGTELMARDDAPDNDQPASFPG